MKIKTSIGVDASSSKCFHACFLRKLLEMCSSRLRLGIMEYVGIWQSEYLYAGEKF